MVDVTLRGTKGSPLTHDEVDANFTNLKTAVEANATSIASNTSDIANAGGVTVYATIDDLPMSGNSNGDLALVSSTNRLYIFTNSGWYNIALINQTPIVSGNSAAYELASDGTATVVTLSATDPEGLPITWSHVATGLTNEATVTNVDNVFTITPSTDSANSGDFSITFRASDGVNIGTATSEFTLVFVSQYWDETVLSTGTSSTNGLANSTFIDRSTNAHTVTHTGSPTQTAFHPYLENWSVEFDGSGDYLALGGGQTFTFGAGDFTVEFWMYVESFSAPGSTSPILLDFRTSNGAFPMLYIPNGTDNLAYYVNSSNRITATDCLSLYTWHHVALSRSGTSTKLFVDGSQVGSTYTDSTDYSVGTNRPLIGKNGASSNGEFSGHISNLRMVKGTALYTANFTPPTEKLTSISGTSLLTCQSNRFIDNSLNAHAITPVGNVKASAFNPFGQESEYAAGENKGSMYLNGTSALTVPNNTAFNLTSGDWTIEGWFYATDGTSSTIIQKDNRASVSYPQWNITGEANLILGSGSGTSYIQYFDQSSIQPGNQWTHFAWVREGTAIRGYINGSLAVSGTQTGTMTDGGSDVGIGRRIVGNDNYFDGYISDLSITKGTAKYTDDFPTPTSPINGGNSLYLPMDNAGIFDKTGNNTLTPVGNASTSTTQTKFADTAMYFDGSGDWLTVPNAKPVGNGDFTIEAWVYLSTLKDYQVIYDNRATASSPTGFAFGATATGAPYLYTGGAFVITSTELVSATTWAHVAIVRNSGTITIYVDGAAGGSVSNSTNFSDINLGIGISLTYTPSSQFSGYIENLQILNGVAKYTANFTVPDKEQGITYQAES